MRGRFTWLPVIVVLTAVAAAAAPAPTPLSPSAYRAELDRLLEATRGIEGRAGDVPALVSTLPSSWRIETPDRRFDVPTAWLRGDLHALAQKPDARSAAQIRDHLRLLRDELDAYDAPPRDLSRERVRLGRILAQREFADVGGPSWFERVRQRVLLFLVRLLERVVTSSNIPAIGRIVVYLLVGITLLVTALWVYRSLRRRGARDAPRVGELPPSAKAWTAWLAEARDAGARGAWRDGVHLGYWAAISFLESAGAWPPDRARTPREYLRLVPEGDGHRPVLSSLTSRFELVWYGDQAADDRTFASVLADLERLGCRV